MLFIPYWLHCFLKKCGIISIVYRDVSTFLEKTIIQSWPKIWLHPYIELIPHFLRKQLFSLGQGLVTSLDRNASTFLEKTIIQSLPKVWLHLYIEMMPHFLKTQCFYSKMFFFLNVTYTE